jgi:hypothetical protein
MEYFAPAPYCYFIRAHYPHSSKPNTYTSLQDNNITDIASEFRITAIFSLSIAYDKSEYVVKMSCHTSRFVTVACFKTPFVITIPSLNNSFLRMAEGNSRYKQALWYVPEMLRDAYPCSSSHQCITTYGSLSGNFEVRIGT